MKACQSWYCHNDGAGQAFQKFGRKFVMSLQYLKKEVRDEVDSLHIDKYQSFLQLDFNILGIKVSYTVILSLLMDMLKQTSCNIFTISQKQS